MGQVEREQVETEKMQRDAQRELGAGPQEPRLEKLQD